MTGLGAQAKMAALAERVGRLSREEKTAWALEMKAEANELFRQKKFAEAAQTYFEVRRRSNSCMLVYRRPLCLLE